MENRYVPVPGTPPRSLKQKPLGWEKAECWIWQFCLHSPGCCMVSPQGSTGPSALVFVAFCMPWAVGRLHLWTTVHDSQADNVSVPSERWALSRRFREILGLDLQNPYLLWENTHQWGRSWRDSWRSHAHLTTQWGPCLGNHSVGNIFFSQKASMLCSAEMVFLSKLSHWLSK